MDSQQQQWRTRKQSDQPTTKAPKLHRPVDQQQQSPSASLTSLSPESNSSSINKVPITIPVSALPDSGPSRLPCMGGFFSLSQWQELELQALIYKYMLAGAPVPIELILPIERSIITVPPYYHQLKYQHLQTAMLLAGYWGRCVVDPEPGRCRRTDGKKWRCSREVVTGQKYCDRHVHRGRNRSRKHVEVTTPTTSNGLKSTLSPPLATTKDSHFILSPTLEILPLNQRPPDGKIANGCFPQVYRSKLPPKLRENEVGAWALRKFFDDWPRTHQELTNGNKYASFGVSTTNLSIAIPRNSSDISLKLFTGNGDNPAPGTDRYIGDDQMQQHPSVNLSRWRSHGTASVGGPLAEALHSSISTPSPTRVLHKPNGSASETSSTTT